MDRIIDLRAFAQSLDQNHGKLQKAIRRWADIHSVHSDLSLATDYLNDALRLHATRRNSLQYATLALQQSAIVLYARAMERRSDHRGAVRVTGDFDTSQQEFHQKLVALRDNSIAHFGPEGSVKPWAEDFVLLRVQGVVYRPSASSRRSLFDKSFAQQMLDHIKVAAALVAEQSEHWQRQLASRLNEAMNDDAIMELLESNEIDPDLLGDAKRLFLRPDPSGRAVEVFRD